mmetsp:Transcript_13933/g.33715  ORF Transcript_13933/g.33715 Transcript_13933/m.33715 type:complete len:359 (-) Transcript_13933:194-1270(-)
MDSLVSVYSVDPHRPGYFELVLKDQLLSTLRPALKFLANVIANRYPAWTNWLSRWEAAHAVAVFGLEWRCLSLYNASIGEYMYGLERSQYSVADASSMTALQRVEIAKGAQAGKLRLTVKQKLVSILWSIVLPLLRAHLDERYKAARRSATPRSEPQTLSEQLRSLLLQVYPYVSTLYQAVHVCYQCLYLVNATDFWSPGLHQQRLSLRRRGPEFEADAGFALDKKKDWDAARVASLIRGGLAAALKHSFFGFVYSLQALQWWYQRESVLQPFEPKQPPPAPPTRPPLWSDGMQQVFLPQDKRVCGLCRKLRTNPAASASGFVFCYPCLLQYVRKHHQCPLTRLPMEPDRVRRVFEDG